MRLAQQQKQQLIDNAKKVYKGYLALDFIKSKNLIAQSDTNISALDWVKAEFADILNSRQRSVIPSTREIMIDGKTYQATCAKTNGQVQLTIKRAILSNGVAPIQALSTYTDAQVADLFAEHTFLINQLRSGELAVSVALTGNAQTLTIGGPGKIDLYRTHLITLLNIIHKVESETDLSVLLVALATGTGKTFVQALWMEVLAMSGFTGIFAVPDHLIPQFMLDIRKLLPDDLVDKMPILRRSGHSSLARSALAHLDRSGVLMVADNETLIDQHYQELLAAPSDHTFLSVDEQHELMKVERRRKRLLQLPNHVLSLFLTATPDKETFELSGERPVATMSNLQKQAAGQGRLPKYETLEVPFFDDLNRKHASSWWQWFKNAAYINLPSFFLPELSSAAQFAIERIPFHFHYNRDANQPNSDMRWDLQVPMAHKILCIIDDNETLVNFMDYLRNGSNDSGQHIAGLAPVPNSLRSGQSNADMPMVYSRGGFEPNGAQFLVRSLMDESTSAYARALAERQGTAVPDTPIPLWGPYELIAKEREAVWQEVSAQLPDEQTKAKVKAIADAGMAEQLKLNMFHYLVEYVLSDLTGLDQIRHNQMRKQGLDQFVTLVTGRMHERTRNGRNYGSTGYYERQLCEKIDPQGASKIAPLLADIYQHLRSCHREEERKPIVDNWFLDRSVLDAMQNALPAPVRNNNDSYDDETGQYINRDTFKYRFEAYSDQYLVMSVMGGMEDAETSILNSIPFSRLNKTRQAVFDEHGRFQPDAKARPRHSLMMLVGQGLDDIMVPEYLNFDNDRAEEIADNYFRLGFIGVYASNKKAKGFSDLNLHTVINLAEQTVNPNNSPEVTIQASGRNRGLDDTIDPYYFHVLGHRQVTNFNPRLLERDDYYSKFFDAQAAFNTQCIAPLGEELARRIKGIYYKHRTNTSVAFEPDAVQAAITQEIANFLRNINNRNSHNIAVSRKHLAQVVSKAMSTLQKDIDGLRNPYAMSYMLLFLATSITSIGNGFFYLLNWRQTRAIEAQISAYEANLDQSPQAALDKVYLKIIRQRDASALFSFVLPSVQLLAWAKKKISPLREQFKENLVNNGVERAELMKLLSQTRSEAPKKKKQPRRGAAANPSGLPQAIIDKLYEIERMAAGYGYRRTDLITVFETAPAQRHHLIQTTAADFETLLAQYDISKDSFLAAVPNLPPFNAEDQASALSNAMSMIPEDAMQMLMLLQRTLQLDSDQQQDVMTSLVDALSPILFHPQLLAACQFILGNLNRDDLIVLFKLYSTRDPNPDVAAEMADLVLSFAEVIRTKDKRGFQEKFLTMPDNPEQFPLIRVFLGCYVLGKEVMDAQEHFTKTDYKGESLWDLGRNKDTKLIAALSEQLQTIQMPYRSLASQTKISKGVLSGLGNLGSVMEEENKDDITFLTRIKKHILRPVWWTSNLSKWAFSFVETMKNLYFRARDVVFVVLNKMKELYAYLRGTSNRFEPSVRNEASTKFNKATFDHMRELNDLKPLSTEQVAQDTCPEDTLVSFEQTVGAKAVTKSEHTAAVRESATRGRASSGLFGDEGSHTLLLNAQEREGEDVADEEDSDGPYPLLYSGWK